MDNFNRDWKDLTEKEELDVLTVITVVGMVLSFVLLLLIEGVF